MSWVDRLSKKHLAEDTTDVVSMRAAIRRMAEDCEVLLEELDALPDDGDLPTWWVSMIAVAQSDVSAARDYLVSVNEE